MTSRKRGPKTSASPFMKPMQPDEALAEIVGVEPLPRTEVNKRMWDYIREHGLQDPQDKRMIRADPKLRLIFGGRERVSMFELTKLVNARMSSLEGDKVTDYPWKRKE